MVSFGGGDTLSHPCKQLCPPDLLWALQGALTVMLVPDLYGLSPSCYTYIGAVPARPASELNKGVSSLRRICVFLACFFCWTVHLAFTVAIPLACTKRPSPKWLRHAGDYISKI
jgi:hypothetical protein